MISASASASVVHSKPETYRFFAPGRFFRHFSFHYLLYCSLSLSLSLTLSLSLSSSICVFLRHYLNLSFPTFCLVSPLSLCLSLSLSLTLSVSLYLSVSLSLSLSLFHALSHPTHTFSRIFKVLPAAFLPHIKNTSGIQL